jgi:hypothetical protein
VLDPFGIVVSCSSILLYCILFHHGGRLQEGVFLIFRTSMFRFPKCSVARIFVGIFVDEVVSCRERFVGDNPYCCFCGVYVCHFWESWHIPASFRMFSVFQMVKVLNAFYANSIYKCVMDDLFHD